MQITQAKKQFFITHSLTICLLLFLLPLFLTGCYDKGKWTGDIAGGVQYKIENEVRRNQPQVLVHPINAPNRPLTAVMVPFRMTQTSVDATTIGKSLGREFWSTWLSLQMLTAIEYVEYAPVYQKNTAMEIARRAGADLAIGGYINHYLDGGNRGESSLSVTIEIWDLATGNLIWSVTHAGAMERASNKDFILFTTSTRNGPDPMWAITHVVATDIAMLVKNWISPQANPEDVKNEPSAFGDETETPKDASFWDSIIIESGTVEDDTAF